MHQRCNEEQLLDFMTPIYSFVWYSSQLCAMIRMVNYVIAVRKGSIRWCRYIKVYKLQSTLKTSTQPNSTYDSCLLFILRMFRTILLCCTFAHTHTHGHTYLTRKSYSTQCEPTRHLLTLIHYTYESIMRQMLTHSTNSYTIVLYTVQRTVMPYMQVSCS